MSEMANEAIIIPPLKCGSSDLSTDISAQKYAHALLKKYLTKALLNLAGCRIGDDIKHVHNFRVQLRKFRTAKKVLKNYIHTDLYQHSQCLEELYSALADVRDLDSQISVISEWAALNKGDYNAIVELTHYLNNKRNYAGKKLLTILDSQFFKDNIRHFQELFNTNKNSKKITKKNIKDIYKKILKKRIKSFQKKGDLLQEDSDAADYHALRLAAKKLRYTFEFFRPMYGGKYKKFIEKIAKIQNFLGKINDLHVARNNLLNIIRKKPTGISPFALYEVAHISKNYFLLEKEDRKKFIESFKKINWAKFAERF